jgi:hypothetical protein
VLFHQSFHKHDLKDKGVRAKQRSAGNG